LQLPVSDWYIESKWRKAWNPVLPAGPFMIWWIIITVSGRCQPYSHSLSTGGTIVQDYITYALNTNLHPRIWSANSLNIYSWWLQRSNGAITASFADETATCPSPHLPSREQAILNGG